MGPFFALLNCLVVRQISLLPLVRAATVGLIKVPFTAERVRATEVPIADFYVAPAIVSSISAVPNLVIIITVD